MRALCSKRLGHADLRMLARYAHVVRRMAERMKEHISAEHVSKLSTPD
jgi:hypothetical protein